MRVEHHERESVSRLTAGRRDAIRRDCGHPGIPHAHGTRTAYVSDRCGCTRCRAANRAAEEHRTAAIAVGRWSPYADAQPVREHLERLRQEGLGIERIAGLSNVSRGTVRRLLSYPSEPGERPHRIRAATAQRLLALPVTAEVGSPRRVVAVGATRARIDALTAAGHSLTELARAIGKPLSSLRRSLSRRAVTAQTAMAVEALYDALTRGGAPSKLPGGRTTHPVPATEPAAGPPARTPIGRLRVVHFIERLLHRGPAPFDAHHSGTSRKSRRVAANVAGFQQAQRLNSSMARTGRPSKGDRDVLYTRVPRPIGNAIRALSDQTGMAISDVIAALAAKSLGMPELAPQPPHPYDQQELPLKTA